MSDLSRRGRLEALRDRLFEEIDEAEGASLASVSRELRAILAELDALPVPGSKAPADEIARKRQERRRAASA